LRRSALPEWIDHFWSSCFHSENIFQPLPHVVTDGDLLPVLGDERVFLGLTVELDAKHGSPPSITGPRDIF